MPLVRPSRRFHRSRTGALLGAAVVLGTVGSLIVPALALGASTVPFGHRVARPPYHGTSVSPSNSTYTTGCATGGIPNATQWNPTSGVVSFRDRASARSCPGPLGNIAGLDEAQVSSSAWIQFPLPAHLNGFHAVVLHLDLRAAGRANLTVGACAASNATSSGCFQNAAWMVSGGVYLLDTTTWSYTWNTSWPGLSVGVVNSTSCYLGSCTSYGYPYRYGSNGFAQIGVTSNFNASHSYVLVAFFSGTAFAYLSASNTVITGARATASLDLASPTHYLLLKSLDLI